MNTKPKVLWVEDSAKHELADTLAYIYYKNKHVLTLAEDASTATYWLSNIVFDALIMDIRLPPGHRTDWQRMYMRAGQDKILAQLGLCLLQWLLHPDGNIHQEIRDKPITLQTERIAVFTIESYSHIGSEITKLGIKTYIEKTTATPYTKLIEIIDQLTDTSP